MAQADFSFRWDSFLKARREPTCRLAFQYAMVAAAGRGGGIAACRLAFTAGGSGGCGGSAGGMPCMAASLHAALLHAAS